MKSLRLLLGYRTSKLVVRTVLPAVVLGLCVMGLRAQVVELHVAAAADLTPVLPKLAEAYEREKHVKIVPSFGSSATLTEQIKNGAPFDVFLSADTAHPAELAKAGLAGAPVEYAHGTLVLWARKDSPAQPISLESLKKDSVTRVAIANAQHAPYGMATKQFLEHSGLMPVVLPKTVTAENIAQTAQFVESGNAQCGFISLTAASTKRFRNEGSYVLVPRDAYEPIRQAGVVVKASKERAAAAAFLKWMLCEKTQAMLAGMGLERVDRR